MTAKLYVRRGGGVAADTEYTQLNPSLRKGTPVFNRDEPLIELGMRFEEGEASQGSFQVMDPEAELPTATFRLPPHAVVTLTEDASGDELWLARGRIAPLENGRSGTYIPANAVEWDVTVNDANMDMRGLPFSEPWVRPEETDVQRLNALQLYILNGASSTSPNFRETTTITVGGGGVHLCPNSNTVTMPAKTYPPGTQPADVLADCRETAGKIGAVVIHHRLGVSHLCLLYIKDDDHTTYATAVKISDQVADWLPDHATAPVFEPKWDMGKATAWDHDFVTTALVSIWGGTNDEPEAIYVERPSLISDYEYWGETYNDSESETEAQAELRANRELDYHHVAVATHRASILVSAAQTKLLCAGMSLQVKSAAIAGGPDLGTYVTRRIAELKWEPNPDGRWWAHMQLGRGLRLRPPRRGSVQPKSTTPKPPSTGTGDPPGFVDNAVENGENANILTTGLDVPIGTNQMLLVFTIGQNTATGVIWDSDGSLSGVPTEAFTKLDAWSDITSLGFTQRMSVWYLLNPTPRSDPSSFVRATFNGSLANAFGVILLEDVNQSDPFGNYVFNQNTGATASTSLAEVATQLPINFAGWMSTNVTPASPTPDAGQTQIWATNFNNSAGRGDIAHGAGRGDWSPSWSLGSSRDWMIVEVAVNGNGTVGDTTEPVGPAGSGDPGTGGTFAPINHVHELGLNSEDGEHYLDADGIQYDPTASGLTATDVQEAIDELASANPSFHRIDPEYILPPRTNPTGSGQITKAPETRISVWATSTYDSFPDAVVAGRLIHMVHRRGTNHITTTDGVLIYSQLDPFTLEVVYSATIVNPTGDVRDPYIWRHQSGRLVVTYTESPVSAGTGRTLWTMYSDNFGLTWSTPTEITTHGFGSLPVVGHMGEFPDGTMFMGIYGKYGADTQYSSAIIFSTNRGESWDNPVTIANGQTDGRMYGEPVIRLLASGKLVALLRSDTTDHTYRSVSTDWGQTWSAVADVLVATGRPDFIEVWPGMLALWARNNGTDFESRYWTSWDEGLTWTAAAETDPGATQNQEYAAPVLLAPGYVVVFRGVEESGTDSDIYGEYYFDGDGMDVLGHFTSSRLTVGGIEIDLGGAADGEVLTYDSGTGKIVPEAASGAVTEADIRDAGRWELVMAPGVSPPEPVENPDGDDWVYFWVSGS